MIEVKVKGSLRQLQYTVTRCNSFVKHLSALHRVSTGYLSTLTRLNLNLGPELLICCQNVKFVIFYKLQSIDKNEKTCSWETLLLQLVTQMFFFPFFSVCILFLSLIVSPFVPRQQRNSHLLHYHSMGTNEFLCFLKKFYEFLSFQPSHGPMQYSTHYSSQTVATATCDLYLIC